MGLARGLLGLSSSSGCMAGPRLKFREVINSVLHTQHLNAGNIYLYDL